MITDGKDGQYYLPTQGVQAKDAHPATWKKWFAPVGSKPPAISRAEKMLTYIERMAGKR